jgi:hypothetical protein
MKEYRKIFLELARNRGPKYKGSLKFKDILESKLLTESIFDILKNIKSPYAIIGGHAVAIHGYPRLTDDLDILVNNQDINKIMKDLKLIYIGPLNIGGITAKTKFGTIIDLVSLNKSWVSDAINSARKTKYGMVVSRPYLMLLKMEASRDIQDDTDITKILKLMNDKEIIDSKNLIKEYLPDMIDDFNKMIELS